MAGAKMLLLATANRHKVEEMKAILDGGGADSAIEVVTPERVPGAAGAEIAEDGDTFAANAAIKAREFANRAAKIPSFRGSSRPSLRPRWVVADDSGLCVDALHGAPGVYSSRYAGARATDADNNRKLLEALSGLPPERRGAAFVCTIVCVAVPDAPAGDPAELPVLLTTEGRCRGVILEAGRGNGGFGYDPLFFYPPLNATFGELRPEEKNRVSHRHNALVKFQSEILAIAAGSIG